MSLLFETIRIQEGIPLYLDWHGERMERSVREFFLVRKHFRQLEITVPEEFSKGLVRCNIIYDQEIREIRFTRYQRRLIRTFRLVSSAAIHYSYKFYERKALEDLYNMRGNADEVIIIKNGLITDTTFSNLIFYDGNRWFTPSHPLLKGTCRERLIAEKTIEEREISPRELHYYCGCRIINAMTWPEETEMVKMENILK
ncbi:MAG: aminotransferase class IV [Syntrophothermus sp.]